MRPLLAIMFLVGVAVAAPVPKAVKKNQDAALIVGRWKPADGTENWYEFKDDGTMKVWGFGGEKQAVPYRWTLDPTASPKRMTWYKANATTPTWECVYELDDNALRMTYCLAPNVPTAIGPGKDLFVNGQARDTVGK